MQITDVLALVPLAERSRGNLSRSMLLLGLFWPGSRRYNLPVVFARTARIRSRTSWLASLMGAVTMTGFSSLPPTSIIFCGPGEIVRPELHFQPAFRRQHIHRQPALPQRYAQRQ